MRVSPRFLSSFSAFTLMEVTIALVVLTFMLFTVAQLQLTMRQQAQQFHWQTIALQQLNNMVEAIMVGQADVEQWNRENAKRLPDGQGSWENGWLRLQWRSEGGIWNCPAEPLPHYACFALGVAR